MPRKLNKVWLSARMMMRLASRERSQASLMMRSGRSAIQMLRKKSCAKMMMRPVNRERSQASLMTRSGRSATPTHKKRRRKPIKLAPLPLFRKMTSPNLIRRSLMVPSLILSAPHLAGVVKSSRVPRRIKIRLWSTKLDCLLIRISETLKST